MCNIILVTYLSFHNCSEPSDAANQLMHNTITTCQSHSSKNGMKWDRTVTVVTINGILQYSTHPKTHRQYYSLGHCVEDSLSCSTTLFQFLVSRAASQVKSAISIRYGILHRTHFCATIHCKIGHKLFHLRIVLL